MIMALIWMRRSGRRALQAPYLRLAMTRLCSAKRILALTIRLSPQVAQNAYDPRVIMTLILGLAPIWVLIMWRCSASVTTGSCLRSRPRAYTMKTGSTPMAKAMRRTDFTARMPRIRRARHKPGRPNYPLPGTTQPGPPTGRLTISRMRRARMRPLPPGSPFPIPTILLTRQSPGPSCIGLRM